MCCKAVNQSICCWSRRGLINIKLSNFSMNVDQRVEESWCVLFEPQTLQIMLPVVSISPRVSVVWTWWHRINELLFLSFQRVIYPCILLLLLIRLKKVETSVGSHRVVKKPTSTSAVATICSSSSESEEESSDESEEESESNSSDEDEDSQDKNAKPKELISEVKDMQAANTDVDVEKQVGLFRIL